MKSVAIFGKLASARASNTCRLRCWTVTTKASSSCVIFFFSHFHLYNKKVDHDLIPAGNLCWSPSPLCSVRPIIITSRLRKFCQDDDDARFGCCFCSSHNYCNDAAFRCERQKEGSLRTWWFFRSSCCNYLLCSAGCLLLGWVTISYMYMKMTVFTGQLTKFTVAENVYISAGVGTPYFSLSRLSLYLKVCVLFLELALFLVLSSPLL